jgi:hypothetical protein
MILVILNNQNTKNEVTLRFQIEGYTRLLILRKFSTLPAVIRVYPRIKFEEKFLPTLLLEPPLVLET